MYLNVDCGVHEIYYPDAQHRLLYFPSDFFEITLDRIIKTLKPARRVELEFGWSEVEIGLGWKKQEKKKPDLTRQDPVANSLNFIFLIKIILFWFKKKLNQ